METFRYLFGLLLSSLILRHTDMLSETLQNLVPTSVEGNKRTHCRVFTTLQCMRTQSDFESFRKKVELRRRKHDVEGVILPRKHTIPKRFNVGTAEPDFHDTLKGFYQQIYLETMDLSIASITNRSDQPGLKIYSGIEQLLFKAYE